MTPGNLKDAKVGKKGLILSSRNSGLLPRVGHDPFIVGGQEIIFLSDGNTFPRSQSSELDVQFFDSALELASWISEHPLDVGFSLQII
jgi:hypothetical protein